MICSEPKGTWAKEHQEIDADRDDFPKGEG